MVFSSITFLFYFLPIVLGIYYIVPNKMKNVVLLLSSIFFYFYGEPKYVLIMLVSIIITYLFGILIDKYKKYSKLFLILSICATTSLLIYFKYINFIIQNINLWLTNKIDFIYVVLPIGISFYTFQLISYTIDVYRGQAKVQKNILKLAMYVSLFPQLIAGPIVRYTTVEEQIENRNYSFEKFAQGIRRFIIGLGKKVLIANVLGELTNIFSSTNESNILFYWMYAIANMLQIYFDFSGYSDMASGIAAMFNIQLPLNFDSPYKAESIIDFWKRWHMTLTRFLRKYVYFSMGGSKKGTTRTYVNVMTVFLVSGIWHGAGWTFVIWGALHGAFYCMTKFFQKYWNRLCAVWKWLLTFGFVNVTWIIFRADNLKDAFILIRKIIKLEDFTFKNIGIIESFRLGEFMWVENTFPLVGQITNNISGFYMWIFLIGALFFVLNLQNTQRKYSSGCYIQDKSAKAEIVHAIFIAILLGWSVVSLSGITTFLYFNF